MKKLLALFLALSMVVFSGISAFASGIDYGTWGGAEGGEPASAFFTLSGTNSAAKHESGKEFEIVLDVTDITLQEGGIQALGFRLAYDPALVTPVTKAGEEGNFDAVISGIENWEGFGRLDETAGEYYIAFGGNETAGKIDSTVSARFTFKFTSTAAAVGSDLTFRVTDIRGVDLAGNECSPAGFEVKVADGNPKPLQPTPREELPADAKKIDYVGYKHEGGLTVLLPAKEATTIGALVRLGDAAGIGAEDPDMNYWAAMVVDAEGKVIGIYNKLGRPDGVKTDVAVPAGGIVIGVHGKADAFEGVNIGDSVRVYNITEERFNVTGHTAVTEAGYVVYTEIPVQPEEKEELPEGAIKLTHAGYIHTNDVGVIGYVAEKTTIGDFTKRYSGEAKDMNYFYVAILDENYKVIAVYTATGREPDESGNKPGVKTDVVIPANSYVIGINKGTAADWINGPAAAFTAKVKVGSEITLCNINEQGLKDLWARKTTVELINAGFTVYTEIPVQPEQKEELPEGAFPLTVIGCWYQGDTSFFGYVKEDTTIGEWTLRFSGGTRDLNYYYVVLLDENLKVTAVYDKLGRPDGIKTNVALAAGSYILGVHAGTAESWKNNVGNPFHKTVRVGSEITLYNVNLEGVRAQYDKAENAMLEQAGFTVYTEPVIQPDPLVELPADAKKIDYVGYKHEGGLTVLLPAKEATTIGALVRLGDAAGIGAEDPDMNYWAAMVVDAEGKVIGIYNKLGRPDGVKTDIAVPAGGIVIGVHGKANAFEGVNIGDTVVLYNLTEECFNVTGHKAVTKAGYTVTPAPAKELTPKADAKLEVIDGKVRLYVDNVTIEAFKAMFDNEFTVLDSEGKEVTEGLVKTGMKIDFGEGFDITVLGDVDQNGIVNSTDYLYARRAYLGTLTLSDAQKDAADLGNDAMGNLILLKRHILGTQYIRELLTK